MIRKRSRNNRPILMDPDFLRDDKISLSAKGLLGYLSATSADEIADLDSLRESYPGEFEEALAELERLGYINLGESA